MQPDAILNMQVRIFRKFAGRHHLAPEGTLALFQKFDLFGFISECYDLLHVSGDEYILDEIDEILRNEEIQP